MFHSGDYYLFNRGVKVLGGEGQQEINMIK